MVCNVLVENSLMSIDLWCATDLTCGISSKRMQIYAELTMTSAASALATCQCELLDHTAVMAMDIVCWHIFNYNVCCPFMESIFTTEAKLE